ncbi:MAG TPA: hypothetical protein VGP93_08190 [Polyangiaceae bacterium]|nr:hypothetical protein [Polyangiaceae bacterium]
MSVGEEVGKVVDAIWVRLDSEELEPALSRRGNAALLDAARSLRERLEREALNRVSEVHSEVGDGEKRREHDRALAQCAASVAGLRWLGGEEAGAVSDLERAASLAPSEERAPLKEAQRVPQAFVRLLHAHWLVRHERLADARKVAKPLAGDKSVPELASAAAEIAAAQEPLRSAPTMATVNGFGARLYGKRDVRDDGSYIATRFLTLLFVPVFPLDAFRVIPDRSGWHFLAKAPLSAAMHRLRQAVLGLCVLGALGGGATYYFRSAGYRLSRSVKETAALEAAAHDAKSSEAALARYEQIFDEYFDKVDAHKLEPVALGIVRLATRSIREPLGAGDVDAALGALRRFGSLPEETRGGEAARWVEDRVERWAKALGGADPERVTAALRLVGGAAMTLGDSVPALQARRQALALDLARRLENEWPVAAVEAYAMAWNEPAAAEALVRVLRLLPANANAIETLTPELEEWIERAPSEKRLAPAAELLSAIRRQIDEQGADKARALLLEKGSEEDLKRASDAHPDDVGYRVALAQRQRGAGNAAGALALLEKLGAPGRMSRSAALEFAATLAERDHKAAAADIYEHLLLARLPAYEVARFRLERRVVAKRRELSKQAEEGKLPLDLSTRLQGAGDENAQRTMYQEWAQAEVAQDPEVGRLRERLSKLDDVVSTAVALGTIRLDLAAASTGREKAELLARAERTFLSIQSAGEGLPAYHLGLGTVYYRLGKSVEGEREFAALLGRDEPQLTLEVARAYRALGLKSQARSIAEKLHQKGDGEVKKQAAILLSLIAEQLEEREKWLLECDQGDEYVRASLLEVQANKAFRAGNLSEADEKFEAVFQMHSKVDELDGSGANNAALALQSRYACTGDPKHLVRSVELLDRARRLVPDSALVLQNLAIPLEHLAKIDALRPWLDANALKLPENEITMVVDWLAHGQHREALLSALRQQPSFGRAREAMRQARVLGPNWIDSYESDLHWLTLFEDGAALRALKQQIESASKLDLADRQRMEEAWESGALDVQRRQALDGALTRSARMLESAQGAKTPAARAVLYALMADNTEDLASLGIDPNLAQKAAELYRKASSEWPDLGLQARVATALLRAACLRVVASDSAATRAFRHDGLTMTLWRWTKASDKTKLDAFKAQPELEEALRLQAELPDSELSHLSYLLATLRDNPALAARSRQRITQEPMLLSVELSVLLSPAESGQTIQDFSRELVAGR